MRSGTICLGTACFLLGICALLRFPYLPPVPVFVWPLLLVFVLGGLLCCRRRFLRPACCVLAGLLWAAWRAALPAQGALPPALEGRDLWVEGRIVSLPRESGEGAQRRVRFLLRVERWEAAGAPPGLLLLNWYSPAVPPRATRGWRLRVRLKRPHGYVNPAGLERERYLFRERIRAVGYVRAGVRRLPELDGGGVLAWRSALRDALRERLGSDRPAALVTALTLGDRGLVRSSDWRVLRRTGTGHLLAVSGLHIGLAAGLAWWAGRWLWSLASLLWPLCLWLPAQRFAALASLPAALGYALLAGFSVPTQRALVMLAVLLLAHLGRARPAPGAALALAALCVLAWDPWAAAAPGFWLSFTAVGVILLAGVRRVPGGAWWHWGRLQLLLAVALAPPLLLWFQEWPLAGSLVNLLAVPWMGFLILPSALLGTVLLPLQPGLAGPLLDGAATHLEWLWILLEQVAAQPAALWQLPRPGPAALAAGTLGVLLLLAPLPWRLRLLGPLWMAPLWLAAPRGLPPPGHVTLSLLDVGQGLSAVVETRSRVLVYDTGPGFRGGFNTGEAVLVPYLLSRGRRHLDVLVLSHADGDHVGGLPGLLGRFSPARVYSGEPVPGIAARDCRSGLAWTWDQVRFEFLYPFPGSAVHGNDASCVLKITAAGRALLIAGDLEAAGERLLTARHAGRLGAEVLVLPHHGSRTSSTPRFIASVAPAWALAATGYRNRFRLPDADIMRRYTRRGCRVLNTAQDGMIRVEAGPGGVRVYTWLERARRLWHRPPPPELPP